MALSDWILIASNTSETPVTTPLASDLIKPNLLAKAADINAIARQSSLIGVGLINALAELNPYDNPGLLSPSTSTLAQMTAKIKANLTVGTSFHSTTQNNLVNTAEYTITIGGEQNKDYIDFANGLQFYKDQIRLAIGDDASISYTPANASTPLSLLGNKFIFALTWDGLSTMSSYVSGEPLANGDILVMTENNGYKRLTFAGIDDLYESFTNKFNRFVTYITLNGASTKNASFYAPSTVGTLGQILQSSGSGAPTWSDILTVLGNKVGATLTYEFDANGVLVIKRVNTQAQSEE